MYVREAETYSQWHQLVERYVFWYKGAGPKGDQKQKHKLHQQHGTKLAPVNELLRVVWCHMVQVG